MAEVGPDGYLKCVESVERDAYEIMTGKQYSVSKEFAKELYHILSRLEQLRLDNDLLSTSRDVRKSKIYNPPYDVNKRYEAVPIIKAASKFLGEYKDKMTHERLGVREANQVRELEEWAMLNVNNIEMMLDPYLVDAYNRTRTFSDHVGVTDRFSGFRQNLTRGSKKPFVYEPSWLRDNALKTTPKVSDSVLFGYHPERLGNQLMLPPISYNVNLLSNRGVPAFRHYDIASEEEGGSCHYGGPIEKINADVERKTGILGTNLRIGGILPPERVTRGYLTIDSLYPGGTMEYNEHVPCNSQLMNLATDKTKDTKTLQEEPESTFFNKSQDLVTIQKSVGLDPHPSFCSEYKSNYTKPFDDFPGGNFVVNPSPNLYINGRPYLPTESIELTTEYQTRFNWPDKNNLYRLPWVKS